ncbi:H-NS histone family protein [Shewanella sp. 1CM18E]|uniref:H-NS histone family protein n=1 Tax=Shewanella sp. 1CM18E TaxID=2929169 RepID=UPI0020BEF1CC|nr:H-NS histone family protein [Shewanella sp. 1CM18E]MCK8046469.1 H-NS histone family protein [Shewanella sp. 1CM18E]
MSMTQTQERKLNRQLLLEQGSEVKWNEVLKTFSNDLDFNRQGCALKKLDLNVFLNVVSTIDEVKQERQGEIENYQARLDKIAEIKLLMKADGITLNELGDAVAAARPTTVKLSDKLSELMEAIKIVAAEQQQFKLPTNKLLELLGNGRNKNYIANGLAKLGLKGVITMVSHRVYEL